MYPKLSQRISFERKPPARMNFAKNFHLGDIWETDVKILVFFHKGNLGGVFKYLLFSSLPGEMIQFDPIWLIFFRWVVFSDGLKPQTSLVFFTTGKLCSNPGIRGLNDREISRFSEVLEIWTLIQPDSWVWLNFMDVSKNRGVFPKMDGL